MNAKVNVSFQIKSFCLLIYISNNRITVSYGNSIFLLLRNSHIIFCSSCINVHSHSQCKRVPFSLHLLQHLLFADILECEVKWALESITTNKASEGDGIPVELFQILKDEAVKVLHSICQQIWKTQ